MIEEIPFEGRDASLVEDGPVCARVFTRGRIGQAQVETFYRLYKDCGRIDVRVNLMAPEDDGYFRFRMPLDFDGQAWADVPFGVEPRDMAAEPFAHEIVERGTIDHFFGNRWCDRCDGRRGVAVIAQPGWQAFRAPADERLLEYLLLKTISYRALRGRYFTTKRRMGIGYHAFAFAIVFHDGDWRDAKVYRTAEEFQNPLWVQEAFGEPTGPTGLVAPLPDQEALARPHGSLPPRSGALDVAPANVLASAWYADGHEAVLRVYETEGRPARAQVRAAMPLREARETDFLGNDVDVPRPMTFSQGARAFDVAPWEIVTLRFPIESS